MILARVSPFKLTQHRILQPQSNHTAFTRPDQFVNKATSNMGAIIRKPRRDQAPHAKINYNRWSSAEHME